jgi:hypothetical protein
MTQNSGMGGTFDYNYYINYYPYYYSKKTARTNDTLPF